MEDDEMVGYMMTPLNLVVEDAARLEHPTANFNECVLVLCLGTGEHIVARMSEN